MRRRRVSLLRQVLQPNHRHIGEANRNSHDHVVYWKAVHAASSITATLYPMRNRKPLRRSRYCPTSEGVSPHARGRVSPARMSSAVTPYSAASAGSAPISGSPAPDSHLLTVLLDTPNISATCCWVMSRPFRSDARYAPVFSMFMAVTSFLYCHQYTTPLFFVYPPVWEYIHGA